jgi:ATP-dependent Clp protease ATP-binding subunit ClpC
LSAPAREFLIEEGYSKSMGARPLRRAIEKYIEDPLAEQLLRGAYDGTQVIVASVSEGKLSFRAKAERRTSPRKAQEPKEA